jgi:hypothetical protein
MSFDFCALPPALLLCASSASSASLRFCSGLAQYLPQRRRGRRDSAEKSKEQHTKLKDHFLVFGGGPKSPYAMNPDLEESSF